MNRFCVATVAGLALAGSWAGYGADSSTEPALRPDTVAGWLDFLRKKEDAPILQTWLANTRLADPARLDIFGVIANGPLHLDEPAPVTTATVDERPDPFPQAVAALRVSLVVPDEQWCVVQGNEVFVGDVLVCNFADQVVRIQVDGIESSAIRVSGPGGQKATVPFGPPSLTLTPSAAPQDISLASIPGVSKPRTSQSPSATIPIRLGADSHAHSPSARPPSPRPPPSSPTPPFPTPSINPAPPPSGTMFTPFPSDSMPLDVVDPGIFNPPQP